MNSTTRIDFHSHSTFSDGKLAPEELAERLAAAGVVAAALTDHDTVDGLERFRTALARHGIGFIAGLELTTHYQGHEAHLLAYGFDPALAELQETLRSLRMARDTGVQSITGSMRKAGAPRTRTADTAAGASAAPDGRIALEDAIALVHRAHGRAFLAHPLLLEPDLRRLETLLVHLKAHGLDGIEVFYGPFSGEQVESLRALAQRLGLLASGGSDLHAHDLPFAAPPGVEMPTAQWKAFRDAVSMGYSGGPGSAKRDAHAHPAHRFRRRHFFFHIIFPTVLAIGLFVAAIFALLLPAFERTLLDRKRETIRELANLAWSILVEYEREERAGTLTRAQAQQMAKTRIAALRYGREGKDYFWLQDFEPRIVMHPYRTDLNDRDVSDFTDPRGVRIFVEFAELVRRQQEGYIDYVWQWQDDPRQLVPKESYIKGFAPWGWIIGTGLYTEDVQREIARLERNLVHASLGISVLVALLLLYVVRHGLWIERERQGAEEGLRESNERYRALVEAATEGTLLVRDGRPRYANTMLLDMLGYAGREIELLDLADLIPADPANEKAWEAVRRMEGGQEPVGSFAGALRHRDGTPVECILTLSPVAFGEQNGFVLLAKEVRPHVGAAEAQGAEKEEDLRRLAQAAEHLRTGLFRARAARRGAIVSANPAALRLLRSRGEFGADAPPALADLFQTPDDYAEFLRELLRDNAVERRVLHLPAEGALVRSVELDAVLVRDDENQPLHIDGTIEDITALQGHEAESRALIEKLQTSLLFLHEPLGRISRPVPSCGLETPVRTAAALMSAQGSGAVLVQSESGAPVGIVTDRDLRERVLAAGAGPETPVYRVMSSPLLAIPETAPIFEALLCMEEKNVQHLAVLDEAGAVTGLVRNKELIQFHHYGSIVLTREIGRAATLEEVARGCRRTPELVGALLDCGAHPHSIVRMISSICDAATQRLAALAEAELGPPPAPYAFVALGSQGRQEQTLHTDQDNAIVFAPPAGGTTPAMEAYFAELGRRVCDGLHQAGYAYCRGHIMAKVPQWIQPLAVWKDYFSDWIVKAEPQQLLDFSIFFDLRAVHGEAALTGELHRHIQATLGERQEFFPHLAQNALLFKPPYRLFGRILVGGAGGEHAGQLDLKDALMPIVCFARLYALRHGLEETNTLDRLDNLAQLNVQSESSHNDMVATYDFLMRLRLRRQLNALQSGHPLDNIVNPRKLGPIDESLLKQAFTSISAIQKKISYDFLGGT